VQFRWIPSLKLPPKSLKLKSRERASVIAQKPKLAAAMPLGRLWSRMHAKNAQCRRAVPSHSAFGGHWAGIMTFTTDNCGSKLRAPDKPHEQLADRVPLADPNGPAHAARRPTACSALKVWWSAEMDRLTYSEWQLEAPCRLGGTAVLELDDLRAHTRARTLACPPRVPGWHARSIIGMRDLQAAAARICVCKGEG
jgi:hypothetical protein